MRGLVKLQTQTFFSKPLTYLVSFLLFPFMLLMISSLFGLNSTFIGIIMISLVSNIFFVFVPNYVETKNSILFKRIQISKLSKASFVFVTALICLAWTVGSTYVVLYIIDFANYFYAYFFTGDIAYSIINSEYEYFFVGDLFSILDDAIWSGLFMDGSILHEIIETNRIHDLIEAGLTAGNNPDQVAETFYYGMLGIEDNIAGHATISIIDNVFDTVLSIIDPNYDSYINSDPEPDYSGFAGLVQYYYVENDINVYDDGLINYLSLNAMVLMEENGSHAPVSIISYVFIGTEERPNPDALIEYPFTSTNYAYFNKILFDWRFFEFFTSRVGSSISADGTVAKYSLSTVVTDSGFITSDGSYNFTNFTRLDRIVVFAITLVLVTFSTFSIAFLIASLSKSFAQYSYIAILAAFLILLFSGALVPLAIVFSSPVTYFVANFLPTTNLALFWQASSFGLSAVPLMSDYSIFGYVVIPMLLSVLLFILASVFYTMQEGKFTKRVEFSATGKSWIILTLIAITMFMLFIAGRVLQAYDQMDSGINQHKSNYFLLNFLFMYFGIAMFCFFILYLKGFSSRSIKWKTLMPILSMFMIIIFIGYIFISNEETEYSIFSNAILIINALLIFVFAFTYNVVKRGAIE